MERSRAEIRRQEQLKKYSKKKIEYEQLWDFHHHNEMQRFFNENGIHTTELKKRFFSKKKCNKPLTTL